MERKEETMRKENGQWLTATPERYQPRFMERVLHLIGFHQWTYTENKWCVMCGKKQ